MSFNKTQKTLLALIVLVALLILSLAFLFVSNYYQDDDIKEKNKEEINVEETKAGNKEGEVKEESREELKEEAETKESGQLDLNEIANRDYELSSWAQEAKASIGKQLAFLERENYELNKLGVSNFYPTNFKDSSDGFSYYISNNDCVEVAGISANKEDSKLSLYLRKCDSEADANTLNERNKKGAHSFVLKNNIVLMVFYREEFNSINQEKEKDIAQNLQSSWDSLETKAWPGLEMFSPFDIYTFNSGHYLSSYIESVSFDKSSENNKFVVVGGYLNKASISDFDLKEGQEIKEYIETNNKDYSLIESNILENNLKEYALVKKGGYIDIIDRPPGEPKEDQRTMTCNFKTVYIYNDLIFELKTDEKTKDPVAYNSSDDFENSTCYSEKEIAQILQESRFAMDLLLTPLKYEKAKILDQALSYEGDNYYLIDPRLQEITEVNMNCEQATDCKFVKNDYDNYFGFSVSKDNDQEAINNLKSLVSDFAKMHNLDKNTDGEPADSRFRTTCNYNVCSFVLDE